MARRATGAVLPPKGRQKSWAIRFSDHGKRRWETLGRPEDGWDRERAEARLRQGARQTKDNISRRLKTAIKRANPKLANAGIEPLSLEKVTPYSFRRTYASLRAALRDDPVYAAEQMGHTDPAFTFRTTPRR